MKNQNLTKAEAEVLCAKSIENSINRVKKSYSDINGK